MSNSGKIDSCFGLNEVRQVLKEKSFGVEYQPFIATSDRSVFAYEALARFTFNDIAISPDLFFSVCHDDTELFFEAEYNIKRFQFANRPINKKLFINFDPHILLQKRRVNDIFTLFSFQNNFVIELVENSHDVINVNRLQSIFKLLQYDYAVDDFFKENSMISLALLKGCNILKLDKDTLKEMQTDESFIHVVQGLVKYSHVLGKKIVLEGVEDSADLALAKKLDIDYVQGFLFKEMFIQRYYSNLTIKN